MQQEVINWCDQFGYPIEKVTPVLEKRMSIIANIVATAADIIGHAKNAPKTIQIGKS